MQYETHPKVGFHTTQEPTMTIFAQTGAFPSCQVTVTGVGAAFRTIWTTQDKDLLFLMFLYSFL